MIVRFDDIDKTLPPVRRADWRDDLGNRAFEYEAFLSHNRNDSSANLAQHLREHGVVVWHDNDADLRDRRVRQKVAQALRASRFVVVCIGSDFRNSVWCKEEYVPALRVEEAGSITRVVVASLADNIIVPIELRHCPKFAAAEPLLLAEYILAGNRLPFSPAVVGSTAPIIDADELKKLASEAMAAVGRPGTSAAAPADPNNSICASLLQQLRGNFEEIIQEGQSEEFSNFFSLLRNAFCRNPFCQEPSHLPLPSTLDGQLLRAVCLDLCLASNADNRENAFLLLLAMDERWRTEASLSDVLEFLRREKDSAVIELAGGWFESVGNRLNAMQLDIVQLAALRSASTFKSREGRVLAPKFAEPIRCRVLLSQALADGLSHEELMTLLEQRLDYTLSQRPHPDIEPALGVAGVVLGITDTEVMVRELCSDILAHKPLSDALSLDISESTDLLRRTVTFFMRIIRHASEHEGWPLLDFDEWVLDYVIHPLGLIYSIDTLQSDATDAISAACDILEMSEKVGYEVPCYRRYLNDLKSGISHCDAWKRLQTCLDTTRKEVDLKRSLEATGRHM